MPLFRRVLYAPPDDAEVVMSGWAQKKKSENAQWVGGTFGSRRWADRFLTLSHSLGGCLFIQTEEGNAVSYDIIQILDDDVSISAPRDFREYELSLPESETDGSMRARLFGTKKKLKDVDEPQTMGKKERSARLHYSGDCIFKVSDKFRDYEFRCDCPEIASMWAMKLLEVKQTGEKAKEALAVNRLSISTLTARERLEKKTTIFEEYSKLNETAVPVPPHNNFLYDAPDLYSEYAMTARYPLWESEQDALRLEEEQVAAEKLSRKQREYLEKQEPEEEFWSVSDWLPKEKEKESEEKKEEEHESATTDTEPAAAAGGAAVIGADKEEKEKEVVEQTELDGEKAKEEDNDDDDAPPTYDSKKEGKGLEGEDEDEEAPPGYGDGDEEEAPPSYTEEQVDQAAVEMVVSGASGAVTVTVPEATAVAVESAEAIQSVKSFKSIKSINFDQEPTEMDKLWVGRERPCGEGTLIYDIGCYYRGYVFKGLRHLKGTMIYTSDNSGNSAGTGGTGGSTAQTQILTQGDNNKSDILIVRKSPSQIRSEQKYGNSLYRDPLDKQRLATKMSHANRLALLKKEIAGDRGLSAASQAYSIEYMALGYEYEHQKKLQSMLETTQEAVQLIEDVRAGKSKKLREQSLLDRIQKAVSDAQKEALKTLFPSSTARREHRRKKLLAERPQGWGQLPHVYTGEWRDDKRCGQGVLMDTNGNTLLRGKWFNDKFAGAR